MVVSPGAGKGSVVTLLGEEKCGRTVWIKAEEIMTAKGVCQDRLALSSGLVPGAGVMEVTTHP